MEGSSIVAPEVLASYAADAALEVDGVRGLVEGALHRHRGVRIAAAGGAVTVELHLALDWGASAGTVGRRVQERVAEYLRLMADVRPQVDVVVDEVGPPPASG